MTSTPVQWRREAWAFLKTFVGRPGEVLVDTTNNRLVVHDGATSGGFPAASLADLAAAVPPLASVAKLTDLATSTARIVGRNAILNGNPVLNQRGVADGASLTLSPGQYGRDRWKAGAAGCTYSVAIDAGDATVVVSAGSKLQIVDAPNVTATAYWLSWKDTGTASPVRVWQGSTPSGVFSPGTAYADPVDGPKRKLLVTGIAPGTALTVEFAIGMFSLVQLEAAVPGADPTRFERRHGELALCQRYYAVNGVLPGFAQNANGATFFFNPKVTMRALPTIILLTNNVYCESPPGQQGFSTASATISSGYVTPDTGTVTINGFSGLPSGGSYYWALLPNPCLALSAEL